MENFRERRNLKRFTIPDAIVKYEQEKGFQESLDVSGEGKLINMTVNAARFETQHLLTPGAVAILDLHLKGKESIHVLGNILWVSPAEKSKFANAMVQFFPFSTEQGHNTIESKLQLELLNKEYSI
jgi:uncharacterized OB-fold protein